jgi:anti-anti-sigma regulatory factor
VTYRIQRSMKAGAIVFALSGEMDIEQTERLQEMLEIEKHGRILLDLKEVTLVGREGVEFLARIEASGVGIVNCPEYVRRWILSERRRTRS